MVDKTNSLSASIARRLETLILDGSLMPGKEIPSERQLSQKLGVSRPVLREAIGELRAKGLISTSQGRRSVVTGFVPTDATMTPLEHLFRDHPRTLFDLLEVREVLEGQAAFLAAQRATEEDRNRIRYAYEKLTQSDHSVLSELEVAELDHAFHRAVCNASHNPVLIHTLQSLMKLMLNTVLVSVNTLYHREAVKKQIDKHHERIYQAVMDGKPEVASKVAKEHLSSVNKILEGIDKEEARLERFTDWENTIR
ncbi:MAG: FCD domain-containing protein [Pontibacterium sp.]